MPKFGFSTAQFDIAGAAIVDYRPDRSSLGESSRRLNKVKTLSQSVAIVDSGFVKADRDFVLAIPSPGFELYENLARIIELHSDALLVLPDGFFKVKPHKVRVDSDGDVVLTLLGSD